MRALFFLTMGELTTVDTRYKPGLADSRPGHRDLYNSVMDARTIKDMLDQRPFVPFCARMTDGDTWEVRHPEMAWVLRSRLFIALPSDNGDADELPERCVMCSLLHISSITPLQTA